MLKIMMMVDCIKKGLLGWIYSRVCIYFCMYMHMVYNVASSSFSFFLPLVTDNQWKRNDGEDPIFSLECSWKARNGEKWVREKRKPIYINKYGENYGEQGCMTACMHACSFAFLFTSSEKFSWWWWCWWSWWSCVASGMMLFSWC